MASIVASRQHAPNEAMFISMRALLLRRRYVCLCEPSYMVMRNAWFGFKWAVSRIG